MDPNLKFQLPEGVEELIFRNGDALPLKEPLRVNLSGVLSSPADWFENKTTTINPLDGHVVANYTNRTIVLNLHEKDAYTFCAMDVH